MAGHSLGVSPKQQSSMWRGEPFSDGIDHFISIKNRRQVPSLDGRRSPFSDKVVLPTLALSRKARAGVPDFDIEGATKSQTVSRQTTGSAGGLSGSQSLPSLHALSPLDHPPRHPPGKAVKKDRCKSSENAMAAESPYAPSQESDATTTPSVALDSPASRAKLLSNAPAPGSSGRITLASILRCPSESSRIRRKDKRDRLVAAESPYAASPQSDSTTTPSTALDSPAFQSRLASPNDAGVYGLVPSLRTGTTTPSSACSNQSQGLKWRQGDEIGSGSYGHVYMAQCKSTGHIFAVKVSRVGEENKFSEKLQLELDICKNLRHRHIVACLGHEFVNSRLYIYLEYVPGKSLRHMVNEFGPLEAPLLLKPTRGMLKGLNYLHKCNPPVVHRDLKGANVLIDLHFCVKLADFGCSKCDDMSRSFSKVGSIHWVAPEVLQDAGHGRRADIWSLGCVIIEIATAADPWGSGAFDNMMQAIYVIAASDRTPPIPDVLPDTARDLVSRCLQRSPQERSSASELLKHPFIQSESAESSCCFSRPLSMNSSKERRGSTSTKDSRCSELR